MITRNNRILSTGYNGPAEGIPHCGDERFALDDYLAEAIGKITNASPELIAKTCPRRLLGFQSGDPRFCPAVHAEMNAIITAARMGISLEGATLWMNSVISCKNCFSSIINAGITQLVVEDLNFYDKETVFIAKCSNVRVREFLA